MKILPDLSNLPPIKQEELMLDGKYFRVSSSNGKEALRVMHLEAYEKYLLAYPKKGEKPVAYLNTLFAQVKVIQSQDRDATLESPWYGLKIIKGQGFEEIVSKNLDDVESLLKYFYSYGVLSGFSKTHTQVYGLGGGKFGKVFKARRDTDSQEFAVKVYDTRKLFKENQGKWILYEIRRLRDLDNDHCMRLYEIYEGKNFVYCINELLSGGELIDQITLRKSLTEIECLKIIQCVLKAIAYLDSKKIVHRDIKPPNIVLRNEHDLFD